MPRATRLLLVMACLLAGCAGHQAPTAAAPPPSIQLWNEGNAPLAVAVVDAAGQQCAQTLVAAASMSKLTLCGVSDSLVIETGTEDKTYAVQPDATYTAVIDSGFWFLQDSSGRRL